MLGTKHVVSFADILALDEGIRALVLEQHYAIEQLVGEGEITFEQLSNLSLENLTTVLNNPYSEASQQILNPPSSSFSPGMF